MCKTDYSRYKDEISKIEGMGEKEVKKVLDWLTKKKDHRELDDDLFKSFCGLDDDKALYQFLLKVKDVNENENDPDKLVVCFRGKNLKIYLNNHVVWDIRKGTGGYVVEFNFNHARYYKGWENILKQLKEKKYGFDVHNTSKDEELIIDQETGLKAKYRKDTKLVTGGEIGIICCTKKSFSEDFVKGTYSIFTELIESFMQEGEDQFRKKTREIAANNSDKIKMAEDIKEAGSNPYIEKRWQQRLFTHFKEKRANEPWIFAYDLEFSQGYPNSDIKKMMETNQPDLMAIQFDDEGYAEKLLLIEVKSTYKACWAVTEKDGIEEHQSDLWKHVKGMKAYSDMSFFVRSRIDDAYEIMTQYKQTGLYPSLKFADLLSVRKLNDSDVKRIILFTNAVLPDTDKKTKSAMDFLHNSDMKKRLDDLIETEDPECEIWYTENNYYSDQIKLKRNTTI